MSIPSSSATSPLATTIPSSPPRSSPPTQPSFFSASNPTAQWKRREAWVRFGVNGPWTGNMLRLVRDPLETQQIMTVEAVRDPNSESTQKLTEADLPDITKLQGFFKDSTMMSRAGLMVDVGRSVATQGNPTVDSGRFDYFPQLQLPIPLDAPESELAFGNRYFSIERVQTSQPGDSAGSEVEKRDSPVYTITERHMSRPYVTDLKTAPQMRYNQRSKDWYKFRSRTAVLGARGLWKRDEKPSGYESYQNHYANACLHLEPTFIARMVGESQDVCGVTVTPFMTAQQLKDIQYSDYEHPVPEGPDSNVYHAVWFERVDKNSGDKLVNGEETSG